MQKPCRFRSTSHFRPRINVSAFALLAFAFATLACACALPTTRLAAQDVTVMPPTLFDLPDYPDQPDTPPTLAKQWLPAYPKTLSKSAAANPGYVIIAQFVDEKGQLAFKCNGSTPGHAASVTENLGKSLGDALQISPATKDGKPVACASWMAVLFNPASASATAPAATPRLLKAALIMVTEKQAQTFPKGLRTLRAKIEIGEDGTPKNPRFETKAPFATALLPAVEKSLAQWQFAPARKAGQPVPGTVNIDLLFQTARDFDELINETMSKPSKPASNPDMPAPGKMPEVIWQIEPFYPPEMEGISGEVTLQFIVDTKGKAKDPMVVSSSNRGFEKEALDTVLRWKFRPALDKDGKPMPARMRVTIAFHRDNDW